MTAGPCRRFTPTSSAPPLAHGEAHDLSGSVRDADARKAQSANSGPRRFASADSSSAAFHSCASTLRGYFYVFSMPRLHFRNSLRQARQRAGASQRRLIRPTGSPVRGLGAHRGLHPRPGPRPATERRPTGGRGDEDPVAGRVVGPPRGTPAGSGADLHAGCHRPVYRRRCCPSQ